MLAYVEWDGRVYLVERKGKLTLPELSDALKNELDLIPGSKMNIDGADVIFCTSPYGKDWILKDNILLMPNVDGIVKKAIITSYPRPVVGGIALRGDKEIDILMARPKRGIYMGWILPGGFIEYGETPEDALRREVEEELNLRIGELDILGATTRIMDNGYSLVSIFYVMSLSGDICLKEDEINEVRWLPVKEVMNDMHIFPVLEKAIKRFRSGCCVSNL